eukprot:13539038-Alexandrium_andersonii.AAC.1
MRRWPVGWLPGRTARVELRRAPLHPGGPCGPAHPGRACDAGQSAEAAGRGSGGARSAWCDRPRDQ